jgi:hypothetical protein
MQIAPCNGGTMHVRSTNSATDFADFYMLAATIHWCNLVYSTNVLVGYKEKEVFAAPLLIV